jgi:uncharacterized protein YxeA
MKKTLTILGVISVIIAGTFYATVLRGGNKYVKTANIYMSYVRNKDSELSYSLLSANEKAKFSTEDWKKYIEKVSGKFPSSCKKTTLLKIVDAEKAYTSENEASRYACDFELDGSNYRIVFVFITENSKIVIDEMQGYSLL